MFYLAAFPSVLVPMLLGLSFHDVQNSICIPCYGHRYLHACSYLLFQCSFTAVILLPLDFGKFLLKVICDFFYNDLTVIA